MNHVFDAFSTIMTTMLHFQLLCISVRPWMFNEVHASISGKDLSL